MIKKALPILAIETSGNLCSAGILLDEKIYAESKINKKNIHSEILFELIQDSLSKLRISITDINSVVISEGPGSFTGLRIGMAAAKGIADGGGLPIIPVPTFDALAFELSHYIDKGKTFCIANKANRDEYYFSSYVKNETTISVVEKLKLINDTEIEQILNEIDIIFGNYSNTSSVEISSPSALSISRWAYLFGNDLLTFEYDYLEPNYFKNFKVRIKNEK